MADEIEPSWRKLSEEVLSGMKEWRQAHPKATLREIEEAVVERMSRLTGRMIQDLALTSTTTEGSSQPPGERPRCPHCGTALQARGKRSRHLQSTGGHDLELTRSYGTCPTCGVGLFPLDEELGLLPGSLSPQSQDHLARLAAWMPFAPAAEMLAALTGVQVSEATIRRQTYTAGAAYEAVQAVQATAPEEPAHTAPADKLVLSADGAMVPLLHGQWAEVKTLVIGEVPADQQAGAVKSTHLSYFSRMSEASAFAEQASVETRRRGVTDAGQVCAVMDGAEWIDGFMDFQCPDALRILDFPHAAQAVSVIGQEAGMSQSEASPSWLATQLHTLKHEGPTPVLAELRRLCATFPLNEPMSKQYAYLARREERMQYHQYQQDGWPIGSGIVERGNKVVMQARLKGAGMHWAPGHVNPMLALRTAVCNDRWDEAQQQLRASRHEQRHLQRHHLVLQRARHQVCRTLHQRIVQRSQEPPPPPALPATPAPPTTKLMPKYSWRHPFLRQPSCAKT